MCGILLVEGQEFCSKVASYGLYSQPHILEILGEERGLATMTGKGHPFEITNEDMRSEHYLETFQGELGSFEGREDARKKWKTKYWGPPVVLTYCSWLFTLKM